VTEIVALGPAARMPTRERLEAAARRPLDGYAEDDVPADRALRRPRTDVLVAGRAVLRRPEDPVPEEGIIDLLLEREGGFGSGAHPTTRMCVELMLDLAADGAFTDVGCGAGTLSILAAKLGFAPVHAVDRAPAAIEATIANAAANGVDVEVTLVDAEAVAVRATPTMVVNAPPSVHAGVCAALSEETTTLVISGAVGSELEAVLEAYAAVGMHPARRLDADVVWSAIVLQRR
jgi:ribosomal protein L11 methyltransferase